MIFCDTADRSNNAIDDLICFVGQLRAQGFPAVVSEAALPGSVSASNEFDLAAFLTSAPPVPGDRAIILAAERIDAETQRKIAARWGRVGLLPVAIGHFETRQDRINAETRLAYALSSETKILDSQAGVAVPPGTVPIFHVPVHSPRRARPRVGLMFLDLNEDVFDRQIQALAQSRDYDLEIVTDGKSKSAWQSRNGEAIPVWHLGELMPRAFAARYDIALLAGAPVAWTRYQMMLANLIAAGAAMVDLTPGCSWMQAHSEFIQGPRDLTILGTWLSARLVPVLDQLRAEMQASDLAGRLALPDGLRALRPPPETLRKRRKDRDPEKILFIPTNGVGLGHAKRCALIADGMRERAKPVFAAFPSCIEMLTRSGFDVAPLIGRTTLRPSHSNDVVNTSRIGALAETASGVVFDGGYVFDSLARAIGDNALPSVWIRRGLWQVTQNNRLALDRQKHFSSILVPEEAFEELNEPHGVGRASTCVGPIVQRTELTPQAREELHSRIARELGRPDVGRFVVTMLGGGVAADRTAQVSTIAAHLASVADLLHIVVTWPTAQVHPSWFLYENTHVVRTLHAGPLIHACDLFISAVGYNSFHEAIYGGIPSIFVPQMAGFMDDQRARAAAASERELAVLVEPWDLLTLTRRIDEGLEGRAGDIRARLAETELPETGNAMAARHLLEVLS